MAGGCCIKQPSSRVNDLLHVTQVLVAEAGTIPFDTAYQTKLTKSLYHMPFRVANYNFLILSLRHINFVAYDLNPRMVSSSIFITVFKRKFKDQQQIKIDLFCS